MARKKDKKPKSPMRGVSCQKVGDRWYWYAYLGGKRQSFGPGKEGMDAAVAAKSKEIQEKTEAKLRGAGYKARRAEFRTFKDLSDWYMLLPEIQRLKYYPRKVSAVIHLMKFFKSKQLGQIDTDLIEKYREVRTGQGASSRTIDIEVENLKSMYRKAAQRKKIPHDLIPGEFPMENSHVPRRTITQEEYEKLLSAADPNLKDFMVCGWESGMRSGEICGLKASKIVLDEPRIVMTPEGRKKIPADYFDLGIFDTKTGARRTVPISDELREVLERRMHGLGPDDYVFTTRTGKPYRNTDIPLRLAYCCKRAGIPHGDKIEYDSDGKPYRPGITFHCFRHTRVSLWIEMGYSDEIVRRASGHRSLEAYRKYAKPDPGTVMLLVRKTQPPVQVSKEEKKSSSSDEL